ncbi:MAG: aminoacyl-tRNA hydrolase [Acidobacteriota bacterium]|nr:aminoacyl-tRNA hydrolase [Acidobacteriota bacterium]
MKLIAGLGNPGYEYYLTPHNLGFMAVDRIAEGCGAEITRPEGQALTAHVRIGSKEAILAKPQTYMNLSGLALGRLMEKHQIGAPDLIVLADDADLPLGILRIRAQGGAGGHNGLKSIIGVAESDEFARVRMGIKPGHPIRDLSDYVLGRFRNADLETVAGMIDLAAEAAEVIVTEGVQTAMNRFNRRVSC